MTHGINANYDEIHADIDAQGPTVGAAPGATGPGMLLPPPGMPQQQDPAAMMQLMMQSFMQMMMDHMKASFPQATPRTQNAGAASAAFRPQEDGHWRQDTHMANVRLDERAFRRL